MPNQTIAEALHGNSYPGRGILIGLNADAKHAVIAYFIMGRSENSRNRVFVADGEGLRTKAHHPALLQDPSLVIYSPVRVWGGETIVTNGDQTDTIFDTLRLGGGFEEALRTRLFEPDAPHYTPRISGLATTDGYGFSYRLSILKSDQEEKPAVRRFFYEYAAPRAGEGHFIHTYQGEGNPLPSFAGDPHTIRLSGGIDELAQEIWSALNPENRVSLFVRYIHMPSFQQETRILNKNEGE